MNDAQRESVERTEGTGTQVATRTATAVKCPFCKYDIRLALNDVLNHCESEHKNQQLIGQTDGWICCPELIFMKDKIICAWGMFSSFQTVPLWFKLGDRVLQLKIYLTSVGNFTLKVRCLNNLENIVNMHVYLKFSFSEEQFHIRAVSHDTVIHNETNSLKFDIQQPEIPFLLSGYILVADLSGC